VGHLLLCLNASCGLIVAHHNGKGSTMDTGNITIDYGDDAPLDPPAGTWGYLLVDVTLDPFGGVDEGMEEVCLVLTPVTSRPDPRTVAERTIAVQVDPRDGQVDITMTVAVDGRWEFLEGLMERGPEWAFEVGHVAAQVKPVEPAAHTHAATTQPTEPSAAASATHPRVFLNGETIPGGVAVMDALGRVWPASDDGEQEWENVDLGPLVEVRINWRAAVEADAARRKALGSATGEHS